MNVETNLRLYPDFRNWLAILMLLSSGILWPPVFAHAAQGAVEPGDARAGSLFMKSSPDSAPVEAIRQLTRIQARITGNVARVHVTQTFENTSDQWMEGLYTFPLAAGAAVDELEMIVGERRIRGEIQKKEEARATYEKAKSEGRRAALIDQERPNMFSTSVANIAPHSSITVDIAYLDTVPFRDGRYTLNLPLSITPRYTPGIMATTTATPERLTAPMQRAEIQIELLPGFALASVRSVNHEVTQTMLNAGRRFTLQSSIVPADRDFELVWTPAVLPDTQATAFAEPSADGTYVLLSLMPPQMAPERAVQRDLLFIIDTSGSMSGPSIEQARDALQMGVDRLAVGDRFNIIRFSNDADALFQQSQPVNAASRDRAAGFIRSLSADGGTEMRSALDLAFSMQVSGQMLRQIVFITDGSVSNEAELVRSIHERIGGARLFTVGIGAAPNAYFMREAAAAGRGSYTFIPRIEEVRDRMGDLFHKLERPALVDLQLHWPGDAPAELAAALPGDVYAGDPLIIAARLPGLPTGVLTLTGQSHGGAWTRQLTLRPVSDHGGIAKLWARERIGELSRQRQYGDAPEEKQASIIGIALAHHLVSEFTSLVAVDVTPARPMDASLESSQAATSAPRGSYWTKSTAMPGTATAAPLLLLVGLMLIGLAGLLRR